MRLPRLLITVPVIVLVAAVAGAAAWWFFVREDNSLATSAPQIPPDLVAASTGTPAAATPGSAGSAPASSDGALTFRIIADRSDASYFADEKLAALPLPSTAKGSTKAITGEFHLLPDGSLDPAQASTFTVDLTKLKSDKDMRDRRVQSQGLETGRYPTATFTAKRITGWDTSLQAGQEQTLRLTGTLELHGVRRDVTWDVKARRDAGVITALATTKFNFGDFNIPILNIAGFVSVQDGVTLQVQVVAEQV
jgi:polyisoprenoid-binding protein YceI